MNAAGFASGWVPNAGFAEKLKAGDVLPNAGGALNAEFALSTGFVSNIPPVLFWPNTNGVLAFVFVLLVLPNIPVDAVVTGVVDAAPNPNGLGAGDPNALVEFWFGLLFALNENEPDPIGFLN